MATTQRSLIVGIFTERAQADLAVEQLQQAGFNHDLLSLSERQGRMATGVRSLFSGLQGEQRDIVDELKDLGVPKEEADYYQNELDADRTIVTVQASSRQEEARAILKTNGAYDINTRPKTNNPS